MESSQVLQLTTETELRKTKETLEKFREHHQAPAETLRNEISRLKMELATVSGQNTIHQSVIGKQKASIAQLERKLSEQDGQHKAGIEAMLVKNNLSARNEEYETDIENSQDTMKEREKSLSENIDQLLADKNALSTQITHLKTEIHGLEEANSELAKQNTQCQVTIHGLEAEKIELTNRNEENESQIQIMINDSGRLETANSRLKTQANDLQEAVRTQQLQNDKFASEIEELTARNQRLEAQAVDQSDRVQQLQ